jgi:hypothetical protein
MTNDERFKQWVEWIDVIYDDVGNVLLRRHVLREVQAMIAGNPDIAERPSAFFDWMASTYAAAQVMGVRRQVDQARNSVSLIKLLRDIVAHPEVMTRERHAALYAHMAYMGRDVGNRSFDEFAGVGAPYLDRRRVQPDIDRLRLHTGDLERFASMRVAHRDPGQPPRPTFTELDRALEVLEDVVRKYALLLLARGGDIVPVIAYDWRAIFRVPWER